MHRESRGDLFGLVEVLSEGIFRGKGEKGISLGSYLAQGIAPRLPSKVCKL